MVTFPPFPPSFVHHANPASLSSLLFTSDTYHPLLCWPSIPSILSAPYVYFPLSCQLSLLCILSALSPLHHLHKAPLSASFYPITWLLNFFIIFPVLTWLLYSFPLSFPSYPLFPHIHKPPLMLHFILSPGSSIFIILPVFTSCLLPLCDQIWILAWAVAVYVTQLFILPLAWAVNGYLGKLWVAVVTWTSCWACVPRRHYSLLAQGRVWWRWALKPRTAIVHALNFMSLLI